MEQTIYALSSGSGLAGVAVVRLSGQRALSALETLTGRGAPAPRRAVLRRLTDPENGAVLDDALVLTFKGPASFTGEDVVEFHVHGGRAVVDGVLSALSRMEGLRAAEAGEFSRRAFDAGKLDLTEIEGLADLLAAQTSAQREQALRQLDGGLSRVYEDWRGRLVAHLAHLEADIDFPDEDLPDGVAGAVAPDIRRLRSDIEDHLADGSRGERLRDGFRIVIMGEPNAGKSTLLNHLAKSDIAIVTDEAGTTRDALDIPLDLGGYPVRVIDTAGIREGEIGRVEAEGIRRAEDHGEGADLRLILIPAKDWPRIPDRLMRFTDSAFVLITQIDRLSSDDMFHVKHSDQPLGSLGLWPVSVHTGAGLQDVLEALEAHVRGAMDVREAPAITRARHREALTDCTKALLRFEGQAGHDAVLAAEEVRMAARALGRITGRVGVEDLLDVIFSDFCIGK